MTLTDPLFLIGVIGIVAILVICGFGMAQSQAKEKMRHAERMKALETGREIPDDPGLAKHNFALGKTGTAEGPQAHAKTCFGAAFWIGFWGFVFAGQSGGNVLNPGGNHGVAIAIAIAAATGASVVTALICGTVLACRPIAPASTGNFNPAYTGKPYYAKEEV